MLETSHQHDIFSEIMVSAADDERQLPSCQNDKIVEDLISSVLFIGYNINPENEKFFHTNPLLGSLANMEDVRIFFTGLFEIIMSLFAHYVFCF